MSDTFPAGTRALQVPVVLRGVEARCDEARFPSLLALTLGAADLHMPPIEVSAVRVSGPVSWRSGLLGVELYTQFIFFFTISATAPFDHDGLLRALARAIHTSLTLRLAPAELDLCLTSRIGLDGHGRLRVRDQRLAAIDRATHLGHAHVAACLLHLAGRRLGGRLVVPRRRGGGEEVRPGQWGGYRCGAADDCGGGPSRARAAPASRRRVARPSR